MCSSFIPCYFAIIPQPLPLVFPRRSLSHMYRFTFILLRQFPATHFVNKHLLVIINSYQLFYSTEIGWNVESDCYRERQSNARVSYDSTPIKGGSTGTLRKKERKTVFSHKGVQNTV